MAKLSPMTDADRARVAAAVSTAEGNTSGEIVTILAARSDDYADVALAWSALVALAALLALAWAPDVYLALVDRLTGTWARHWTPGGIIGLAALVAALKFGATWAILLWRPLRLAFVPGPIRHARVHARALAAFRVGAERRTTGRTGILIYLSLAEHRAEILADQAIASKVSADLWGEALAAMLARLKDGQMADGLIAAIERVGAVLAQHLPRAEDDRNELPDRLIEV
ncbi:TPM domain-containing protein [Novosphingobium bradum]|uniref:TPM domain-containing protein n=1 Tax=Novosphingobium bradum TaxID=1737444 RepID=A0ABV7IMM6_9SPHN